MLSDAEFLEQFDAGTLDLETFDHTAHFRAAWLCLREAPFRDALGRLRRGLKRLAISAGRPQRYHETITVAYARLIARQMRALGNPPGTSSGRGRPSCSRPAWAPSMTACSTR